jgi:hypothetical protein
MSTHHSWPFLSEYSPLPAGANEYSFAAWREYSLASSGCEYDAEYKTLTNRVNCLKHGQMHSFGQPELSIRSDSANKGQDFALRSYLSFLWGAPQCLLPRWRPAPELTNSAQFQVADGSLEGSSNLNSGLTGSTTGATRMANPLS